MISKPIVEIIKKEIRFDTSKSSGPGGQNINKRNTKVTGIWNFSVSKLITQEQKNKIAESLKNKVVAGRVLIISSQKYKLQNQNKKEVIEKMAYLISKALKEEKKRIPTKPTIASKEKRIAFKKNRSLLKKLRLPPKEK
jgi:ribosome-associated protein